MDKQRSIQTTPYKKILRVEKIGSEITTNI